MAFVAQSEFLNSTELSKESRLVTLRSRNERFLKIPPPASRAQIPPKQRATSGGCSCRSPHGDAVNALVVALSHQRVAMLVAVRSAACKAFKLK